MSVNQMIERKINCRTYTMMPLNKMKETTVRVFMMKVSK